MRTKTTKVTGSGRRLEPKNRTLSDQEQADSRYNELPMSVGGGPSSVEGREEITNTLESAASSQYKPQDRQQQQYELAQSCDELRCRRGGYCVMDKRQGRPTARCQCPLGTKGRQCETGSRCV